MSACHGHVFALEQYHPQKPCDRLAGWLARERVERCIQNRYESYAEGRMSVGTTRAANIVRVQQQPRARTDFQE